MVELGGERKPTDSEMRVVSYSGVLDLRTSSDNFSD